MYWILQRLNILLSVVLKSLVIKGNTVKSTMQQYRCAFGKRVISKGTHHWKFKMGILNNYNGSYWNYAIGLCREN